MMYNSISNDDTIKVCKCGNTKLVWQTVCSNCNEVNIINSNK